MHVGDLIEERYRLETPLGQGGMAEVWRALDERLQRPVAIKFLTARFAEDPEFLVRFFSEAQAIAAISHPHVVRVLDFGHAEAGPFLVMELVEGGSLCDRLGAPLEVGVAFELIAQAADGAGAAHAAGIVHRDLKPGNILLGRTGVVKLADFGIATVEAGDHLTATGTAIGSPNYISPEGAQGSPTSPAADVYSLGIVLYELLTGRRPFDATSPTALAIAHVDEKPVAPSTYRPDLPPWVDALVLRCLAKDPTDRFEDGAELAAALRAGEAGAPVLPTAAAPGNRRRATVAALAAVAVLALAGFLLAAPGSPDAPVAEAEATEDGGRDERGARPTPSNTSDGYDDSTAVTVSDATPTPSPTETKDPKDQDGSSSPQEAQPRDDTQEEAPEEPVEEETTEPEPPDDSETEEPLPEESETEEPPPDDGTDGSAEGDAVSSEPG